ncbi:acetolactate synthase-1/2/3 large subunit [Seinonella peptonophila]|uniref:Acetolactate synthase-1/2/3 large subunit n=1 Tax=Seinonella peptonophila TaxID=112248 RepID=A0A1M4V286_9BACL|nr:acetolactate synthase large subunit [Seinonella peptonophila]SHE63101.1 acetolactate synthase-1/2/3 large subunit [Seinonella peptonophila]
MKVAELFVRCLENEGVEYIFGVPGEETLDLMEALKDSKIEFIVTRHETGAAFMAGMMGRLTGKPGVCLSTLGPGATNMLTGVADANMNRAPIVAITAQAGMNRQHKESHQAYDLVSLYRPVTKWSASIRTPETTGEIIHKAFQLATTEKPGATHIELPEDIARLPVDGQPIQSSHPNKLQIEATDQSIQHAAELINHAKQPIILCGNGVARNKAEQQVLQLAEHIQTPVTETFMGKGTLPSNHPLAMLTTGFPGKDYIQVAFAKADLIITIGFDMFEYRPDRWNAQRTPILHIDSLEAEIDAHYPVRGEVVGDLQENIKRLIHALTPREQMDEWYQELRTRMREEIISMGEEEGYPLKPQRIMADLKSVLAHEDLILSDVGAHKIWMGRMYPADLPNTCLISNGLASMGYALPSAIAAKMVHPERNVVAVVGDGSFLMTGMELETAVRHQLPIIILIWRDDGYGLIQWKQLSQFQHSAYIKFGNPDFVSLAESFGALGYRVNQTNELVPILQKALTAKQPVIIDCPVDYTENMDLTKRLQAIAQEL